MLVSPTMAAAQEPPDVAQVFRIEDPEIDVRDLVARIRTNLEQRPGLPVDPETLLAEFGRPTFLTPADELAYSIERLSAILEQRLPSDRMRTSDAALDRVLNRIRKPFHQLVRYYVDPYAERQEELVRWVAAVLGAMAKTTGEVGGRGLDHALSDDVAALRAEVTALRAEVTALRDTARHKGSGG